MATQKVAPTVAPTIKPEPGAEMSTVIPRYVTEPHQAQIDFLDERTGLQEVPGALLTHLARGDLVGVGIDQLDDSFQGF